MGSGFRPPFSGLACKATHLKNKGIMVSIFLNLQAGGAM
jgi:hypothetical protein